MTNASRNATGVNPTRGDAFERAIPPMPHRTSTGILPLPPGEGRGEGGRHTETNRAHNANRPSGVLPPPNPLPEGEGTMRISRSVFAGIACVLSCLFLVGCLVGPDFKPPQ